MVARHAQMQGAQAAQGQPAGICRHVASRAVAPVAGRLQRGIRPGDQAEHHVRVPVEVFGGGMNGDIDTMSVGIKEQRCTPSGITGHRHPLRRC